MNRDDGAKGKGATADCDAFEEALLILLSSEFFRKISTMLSRAPFSA